MIKPLDIITGKRKKRNNDNGTKTATRSYIYQFKILLKGEPWYGDAFEEKLKDVNAQNAYLRPYQMHSIVELMWHMSYWHKVLLEVLQGGTYPEDKSRQWLAVEELDFDDLKISLSLPNYYRDGKERR